MYSMIYLDLVHSYNLVNERPSDIHDFLHFYCDVVVSTHSSRVAITSFLLERLVFGLNRL